MEMEKIESFFVLQNKKGKYLRMTLFNNFPTFVTKLKFAKKFYSKNEVNNFINSDYTEKYSKIINVLELRKVIIKTYINNAQKEFNDWRIENG